MAFLSCRTQVVRAFVPVVSAALAIGSVDRIDAENGRVTVPPTALASSGLPWSRVVIDAYGKFTVALAHGKYFFIPQQKGLLDSGNWDLTQGREERHEMKWAPAFP